MESGVRVPGPHAWIRPPLTHVARLKMLNCDVLGWTICTSRSLARTIQEAVARRSKPNPAALLARKADAGVPAVRRGCRTRTASPVQRLGRRSRDS